MEVCLRVYVMLTAGLPSLEGGEIEIETQST